MALSFQFDLKQSQRLVLTQSLRQSIEMLQLSSLEIAEIISQELQTNPVLEEDLASTPLPETTDDEVYDSITGDLSGDIPTSDKNDEFLDRFGNSSDPGNVDRDDADRKRQYIENTISYEESLAEHLIWQAHMIAEDEEKFHILEEIITSLDRYGFIAIPPEKLAQEVNVPLSRIKDAIGTIQGFDPVGCATAGIRESLLVQARHYYPEDSLLHDIIENSFDDIEKLDYESISKKYNLNQEEVIHKGRLITYLSPYPGLVYSRRDIRYIIPDVEVKLVDGELVVMMKDDFLPRIRINSYYNTLMKQKNIEKNQRDYIQDKLQSARSFMKNIRSRRETILKVVRAIMEYQMDFLRKGPGNLKYLTHLDIAEQIGMHESTVSRVTSNKFVQTTWGVFELKHFFVSRLKSVDGSEEERSSDQVKNRVAELIKAEPQGTPLSDEDIVDALKEEGIQVARRTVAKYRGLLGIPSSNKRKKLTLIKEQERKSL